MIHLSTRRRAAAVVAALVAGLAGASAVPSGADASTAGRAREVPKTTITIKAPGCDGCRIALAHAVWPAHGVPEVWESRSRTVHDGAATFRVRTARTHGLSMTVTAPWEGQLGYVTTVVFRYAGERAGDPMRFRRARDETRGSACWAGTREDAITIPLAVKKVRVSGLGSRVAGSIAFTRTTRHSMRPMRAVRKGVMGSQDVNICGRR